MTQQTVVGQGLLRM